MSRFWQIYAWGTLIAAFLCLLVIGCWLFCPVKVMEFSNNPFPVSPVIKAGDELRYSIDYCKYAKTPSITTRQFVDEIIFVTPAIIQDWQTGCHTKTLSIQVPSTLAEGIYYLDIVHKFEVNPLRTETVDVRSQPFQVVK